MAIEGLHCSCLLFHDFLRTELLMGQRTVRSFDSLKLFTMHSERMSLLCIDLKIWIRPSLEV